jgi:hypothetical protein
MWLMHFHLKNAAQSEKASQMICRQNKSSALCKVRTVKKKTLEGLESIVVFQKEKDVQKMGVEGGKTVFKTKVMCTGLLTALALNVKLVRGRFLTPEPKYVGVAADL